MTKKAGLGKEWGMNTNPKNINGVREFFTVSDFANNNAVSQFSDKYLIERANENAKIPPRFANTRIGDYELDFNQEGLDFAIKPRNDKIFILAGTTGTGKSTFLTAMVHERAVKNLPVGFYFNARRLASMIRASRSFSAKVSEDEILEMFCTVPFLVYDELGTSEDSQLEKNFFRTVLACRYDNELSWAVGTNFTPDALRSFVTLGDSDPILDRLNSIVEFHALVSESHR